MLIKVKQWCWSWWRWRRQRWRLSSYIYKVTSKRWDTSQIPWVCA